MTFVVSFGQDIGFIYEEMKKQNTPVESVFLYKKVCPDELKSLENARLVAFETWNLIDMVRSIYHLATSRCVVVDNYFGFLSVIDFKEGVECIQLWHAAGAFKKFGTKDRSVTSRRKAAQRRFRKVYEKFNKVVVGSDAMAGIFIEAFDLPRENILRAGIPRTDLFFDTNRRRQAAEALIDEHPEWGNKERILYAPTYREDELDDFQMKLDLDLMQQELGDDYVVLLHLHPAVKSPIDYEADYPGFVYDCGQCTNINHLLLVADYLITDYSSIPYEFALLNKPMLFYPYDLEEYREQRGLWADYESMVPGPVTHTTSEIIELIKEDQFDLQQVKDFAQTWNRYSRGNSSENFVRYLTGGKGLIQNREGQPN
ncbi:MAG TPA: CDP-glycerol glycerophosphotransferase family protein [Bacillales bacterium]|nr:CDP-glycerol glycerophosphotransferase family protein [Bacillales bacterium]